MPDIQYANTDSSYTVEKITSTSFHVTPIGKKSEKISVDVETHSLDAKNTKVLLSQNFVKKELRVYQNKNKRIVAWPGGSLEVEAQEYVENSAGTSAKLQPLKLTMPGKVLAVKAKEGQIVEIGQGLVIVEAMKMENLLSATAKAKISKIHVNEGDRLESGTILISFEAIPNG